MRRREEPTTESPPIDVARVREIVGEAVAAKLRGENMHEHPYFHDLNALVGSCMAGYYVQGMLSHPDGPQTDGEFMVAHIVGLAPRWAEDMKSV
jgi:hypothetical protein